MGIETTQEQSLMHKSRRKSHNPFIKKQINRLKLPRVRFLKAVILAGGFGTRLRPLSCTRPKTLFPIVNKPLLQWVFERLADSNIKEAILAVNEQTEFYIRSNRVPRSGLKVKYSHDPPLTPLGTAGPIKKAEKLIGADEPFLVLNGDIFTDFSYLEMIRSHDIEKATATIALYEVADPSRYGVADLGPDGRIKEFVEKPTKSSATTNLINAGFYVLSPSVFKLIPGGKSVSMEREIFPKLAKEGRLFGHVVTGLWKDIGKPEEYLETNKLILSNLSAKSSGKPTTFRKVDPIALDKNVSIGENSIVGPYAIVGKNVSIGKNAQIRESVIFPNAIIEDCARIRGAIIGEGAFIGRMSQVAAGCVIGDQVKLKKGVSIAKRSTVCPGKEINENILKATTIC